MASTSRAAYGAYDSGSSHTSHESGEEPSTASSTSSSSETTDSVSLIDRLQPPKVSELARKRKVQVNLCERAPKGKRRQVPPSPRGGQTDPKSVIPAQRVREFPTKQLTVTAGKLFCTACREELGLKRSMIQGHFKAAKHADGKKRLEHKEARERDITVALRKHDQEVHQKGETLPESQRVYRIKVAMAFFARWCTL